MRLGQYWLASCEPLKVAIGLSTGGYVVLESRGEISPRVWGAPAGFAIEALGALVGLAAIIAIMREVRPLRRLFANLLDNALGFGGAAEVTIERSASEIAILVDDDGPGIPALERAAVFEPFYRVEASRSRETGGAGLGLAIARAIVEAHGGRISAEAAPRGGARIRVVLPCA